MPDFCADKNIVADAGLVDMQENNTPFERMLCGDVRYRFVIDLKTL